MRTPKQSVSRRRVMVATVTPLASILGSGLLIILPVLERTLGALSVVGAIGVSGIAWFIGSSIRHRVRVVEPLAEAGELDQLTRRLGTLADAVIVVAYVISVALYLRIMAEYIVTYAVAGGAPLIERLIACAAVAVIVVVGVVRGFTGLDWLDRVSLAAVLVLTTMLGLAIFAHDARALADGGLQLPPGPPVGLTTALLVLSGIVITVQGFETVAYLGHEYDRETRVWASRLAQVIAASIYVGFVAVATPVMGLGTPAGADDTLLSITDRVAPLLALPLVLAAVMSQFSAAVADTVAADGNLRRLVPWMSGARPYLVSGVAAIALAATVGTFAIIAIASRAFAAYYAIQAVIAVRTSSSPLRKLGYGALAVMMTAITVLAKPAG